MNRIFLICGIILCSTLTLSCSKDEDKSSDNNKQLVNLIPEKKPIILKEKEKSYIQSCNEFAFNLFKQTNDIQESRIISPLSLAYILGMLQHGADGDTEQEIKEILGLKQADKIVISQFFENLIENAPQVDSNVHIDIANALFVNKGIKPLASYENDMKNYYKATIKSLDFANTSAVDEINNWCKKQTQGSIGKILDETNPEAQSYFLNAILFKAAWTDHFDPKNTWNSTFTKEDRTNINIPMMHLTANANITGNEYCTTLCLPYSNWGFVMYLMLPNDGYTTQQIIERLNSSSLEEIKRGMSGRQVEISLPRFTSRFNKDMTGYLKQMGLTKAFSSDAQFPYITADQMNVGKIRQSAMIEVNEEGTKTAAVSVSESDVEVVYEPNEFKANHPFVYIIQEMTSGAIFFVGTYMGD